MTSRVMLPQVITNNNSVGINMAYTNDRRDWVALFANKWSAWVSKTISITMHQNKSNEIILYWS